MYFCIGQTMYLFWLLPRMYFCTWPRSRGAEALRWPNNKILPWFLFFAMAQTYVFLLASSDGPKQPWQFMYFLNSPFHVICRLCLLIIFAFCLSQTCVLPSVNPYLKEYMDPIYRSCPVYIYIYIYIFFLFFFFFLFFCFKLYYIRYRPLCGWSEVCWYNLLSIQCPPAGALDFI